MSCFFMTLFSSCISFAEASCRNSNAQFHLEMFHNQNQENVELWVVGIHAPKFWGMSTPCLIDSFWLSASWHSREWQHLEMASETVQHSPLVVQNSRWFLVVWKDVHLFEWEWLPCTHLLTSKLTSVTSDNIWNVSYRRLPSPFLPVASMTDQLHRCVLQPPAIWNDAQCDRLCRPLVYVAHWDPDVCLQWSVEDKYRSLQVYNTRMEQKGWHAHALIRAVILAMTWGRVMLSLPWYNCNWNFSTYDQSVAVSSSLHMCGGFDPGIRINMYTDLRHHHQFAILPILHPFRKFTWGAWWRLQSTFSKNGIAISITHNICWNACQVRSTFLGSLLWAFAWTLALFRRRLELLCCCTWKTQMFSDEGRVRNFCHTSCSSCSCLRYHEQVTSQVFARVQNIAGPNSHFCDPPAACIDTKPSAANVLFAVSAASSACERSTFDNTSALSIVQKPS